VEDKLLIWKFKNGRKDALRRIYEKYKNDLFALAIALLNDKGSAEDVVHDVFVSFAQLGERLQLRGSLKRYLSTCIANRARKVNQAKQQHDILFYEADIINPGPNRPDELAISAEELQQIGDAMSRLPYEQREVIILHLQGGMRFKKIARSRDVSINTIQSRYRYGLDKLRSMLDSEVKK